MPVITDAASAEVKRQVKKLYGKTLTRPALLVTDGLNEVYACDVEINERDITGTINQYFKEKHGKPTNKSSMITGIPGQRPEDWQLEDSLPGGVDTTLHNVVISPNNHELIYADVGAAVIVERTENGNWMITGFSLERPGTHKLYPVDLDDMTIDTVIDLSVETRLLTLAELGEMQPFGFLPFGASAIYQGGQLLRVV